MKNFPSSVQIWFLCCLLFCTAGKAQTTTLGLRYYDGATATAGYTLFSPKPSNDVYLINNCGEIVNQWTFSEGPGLTCYLLENGNLLRAGIDSLEIRAWDNTLLWSYAMTANGLKQHHDIEPLPNGNILCILADAYSDSLMVEEGRDPNTMSGNSFKLEKIVELEPIGTNDAAIVWEWKFIDHLVQDFDNSKDNYDVVEDHPELLDLNFINAYDFDWIHLNGLDYNASLDQIILSSRHMSELYIIDHSTTTAEAESHVGGNAGMGGDFLWRWGNPQVYRQGTGSDQKLFGQHDSKWVSEGYLDEGKISVFNNGGDVTNVFSSIHLIEPQMTGYNYELNLGTGAFLPLAFDWTWQGSILSEVMKEAKKSGTHSLPNGNMMLCESSRGQITEVDKSGNVLWVYKSPIAFGNYNQMDVIPLTDNDLFRGEKYSVDYPGFVGQDLTPSGIIEDQNYLSDSCMITLNLADVSTTSMAVVNPVENGVIHFTEHVTLDAVKLFDLQGSVTFEQKYFSGTSLKTNASTGIYLLKLRSTDGETTQRILVY